MVMLMLTIPAAIFAQGYYSFQSTGTTPPYDYRSATGTDVIAPGSNDVLSAWQQIPFTFSFDGSPVSGFYVSDNGYITFDVTAVASFSANSAVPNAAAPKQAIFAYWTALEIVSGGQGVPDQVFVETLGTAPNRMMVIQWVSVTDGSGNFVYAGIRLYEDGHFDIVHNFGAQGAAGATVGWQNAAGTMGDMKGASPNYVYPATDDSPSSDVVYEYYPGTQPSIDVAHQSLNFDGAIPKDACIGGVVVNRGTSVVTDLEIRWSVDGGTAYSRTFTGLAMATNQTFNWDNGSPLGLTGGNTHDIRVWIGRVNEQQDQNLANGDQTKTVLAQEGTVTSDKRVLLEQFTTSVCQFCPDGKVVVGDILNTTPGAHAVAIHAGFGTDAMTTQDATALADRMANGAPTAAIDRVLYDGNDRLGHSRSDWANNVNSQLAKSTTMCISMTTSFNQGTRDLSADLTITSTDHHPNSDYRVSLMVIESGLVGSGSGWDQSNAYDGQAGHPYSGAGNPIVGFVHDRVLRAMPTGSWGDATVLPSAPGPNTWNKNVTYNVPGALNEANGSVIAFVHEYNDTDDTKMEILNVIQGGFNETQTNNCQTTSTPACATTYPPDMATSIEDFSAVEGVNVYPNPVSNGKVFVEMEINESIPVTLDLFNTLGQKVATSGTMTSDIGMNKYFVDVDGLPSGSYHVIIRTEGEVMMSRNIVVAE